jgi:hypothetical protein
MKKLITLYLLSIVVCILVAILVTSCGSNVFVAKRHYTKGYYVEKTSGLASRQENKTTDQKSVLPPKKPAYSIARDQQAENSRIELAEKNKVAENVTAANTASKTSTTEKITKRPRVSLNPFTNIKTLQELEKKNRPAVRPVDDSSRDGLSLFWIVITIILIVWLIGFLAGGFGLGDFIHILLVIALVLLVLWLLRIV